MMPLVGFLPHDDPRMIAHGRGDRARAHARRLRACATAPTDGIDGLPPGEGVFLLCTFWLADNYALTGRARRGARAVRAAARAAQRRRAARPRSTIRVARRLLGNFPQAFSHVGLINTAFNLSPEHPTPAADRKNSR